MNGGSGGEASPRPNRDNADEMGDQTGQSWLIRGVPGLLIGTGLVLAALAVLIADKAGVNERGSQDLEIGSLHVRLHFTAPSLLMVVAAVLAAVACAVVVHGVDAWAARRVADPARGPRQAAKRPLRRLATPDRPAGPFSVTAVIPARNEEVDLPVTLSAVYGQTRAPDTVGVIADNCTDKTAEIAAMHGASRI
jgi:poly-beta-1,6-N-acetyl-D-glucosamine synthase